VQVHGVLASVVFARFRARRPRSHSHRSIRSLQHQCAIRMILISISTVSSISPPQQVEPATPVRPASDSQVSGAVSNTSGDGRKLRDEMGM
jgi:hypothetical protein